MASTTSTPFPLGAYLGNPDNSSPANQAAFDASFTSLSQLLGASPQLLVSYLDQYQPISQWVGNATWAADSAAQSANAKSMTPVIGLPMASRADTSMTQDQSYRAFASGQYDSMIKGVVQAWAHDGFTTQYWRPGWEMNLTSSPSYAGSDPATQADWIAAFQHISTVLHQAGQASGVNVQVVWNPSTINYSNAEATTQLYPGNAYVDVIGADIYADMYPYNPLYDWDKNDGTIDGSLAQWMADPVNRQHYWTYPAATPFALDGSLGHSLSLTDLLQFAKLQGKPFAIPETGAGNSNGGQDVADDAAFPQWLAQTLQASGDQISFVDLWNSNGGGNYAFSQASEGKPAEAAAWAKYFGAATTTGAAPPPPATVSIGSGSDSLSLRISEDAWQGDAQFTVKVDGTQIGGIQTATASHAAGQEQVFNVQGSFAAGAHSVSVTFLNDAYGGTTATDRNLYVDGATIDGVAVPGTLALLSGGTQGLSFNGPGTASVAPAPVTLGSGADSLVLAISEDAWQGDAQFTVSVDGQQVGGTQTATASHAAGQAQSFTVRGNFGAGNHTASINFLNDAYGGTAATDRNLYLGNASFDGAAVPGGTLALVSQGPKTFAFSGGTAVAATDTLDIHVSEDAWQGDAQFLINVDGTPVGGVRTATASHAAGASQDFSVAGSWGPGSHSIGVTFINDAWGGTAAADRNLYVDQVSYDGRAASGAPAALWSNGTATFSAPAAGAGTSLTLHLAEDAWQGDAQYGVSVDGNIIAQGGTVTALNAQGQAQAVNLKATLSPGLHDLGISFLNDAYGGTAATDRNLYVKGIDVNGTPLPGAAAALTATGTAHFQIMVPSS